MKTLVNTLFGLWCAFSILMNAFGIWLSRSWGWNESGSFGWTLGLPLMSIAVAGCVILGAIKGRGYLLLFGLVAYLILWAGLVVDKWRMSVLVASAVNLVLILLAGKALSFFKSWR